MDKELNYPILVNAITGGTKKAKSINESLAYLSNKYGLAMAVGSQTIALDDPDQRDSFSIVRDVNPDGIILANIGANRKVEQALQAVEMISADALQLHFNVPQELSMPEGDRNFKGIIENVSKIIEKCPVPVIAKEVGFGFSRESVKELYMAGVQLFDNGGKGGTNFIVIEGQRQGLFANGLSDWGIPTAASLAEIISLRLPIKVIASGGIRSASDIAKAIALGADLVGAAGPFLKVLLNENITKLDTRMKDFFYMLKAVFLMTGSRNCEEIKRQPLIILNDTANWLLNRGIDPTKWSQR